MPLVHVPDVGHEGTVPWLCDHRQQVTAVVDEVGAVLIRGLRIDEPAQSEQVARHLVGEPFVETEAFARRHRIGDIVRSASIWPPDQPMCAHHELSYALTVPTTLVFCCLVPASRGGDSGVVDSHELYDALPPAIVEQFERTGWMMTRNYSEDIGLPWSEAFGTDDLSVVQAYCKANEIDCEMRPGRRLRTHQRRRAVVRHPRTGLPSWFNQAAFFNEWTLEPIVRDYLVDVYGAEELPINTFYGDGTAIDPGVVREINDTCAALTRTVRWQAGDVLVLDNVRTAHSREPYEGPREVLVAMGGPLRVANG